MLLGLVGPSGSGKTYSALELATGIQEVSGGDIYVIDTEGRRALHYADRFKFRHLDFKAPFSPADYLAAVEHCAKQGAKTLIGDSWSHEHEGEGGVLEMHEAELERLSRGDAGKRDKVKFLAWVKPKAERRQLLSRILQLNMNFIFCFRAKEKLKLAPGKDPVNLGWQAIAGEEYVYEMTAALLLPPSSGGVPDLSPSEVGEKALVKVPAQFKAMIRSGEPLSRRLGRDLAQWAAGGKVPEPDKVRTGAELLAEARDRTKGDRAAYDALLQRILPAGRKSTEIEVQVAWGALRSDPVLGDRPTVERLAEELLTGVDEEPSETITADDFEEIIAFSRLHEISLQGSGGLLEALHPGPLAELPARLHDELWTAMRAAAKAKKGAK